MIKFVTLVISKLTNVSWLSTDMTSRYRVEYALKTHRRDEFIEWIKGLLAVPFVLHADIENYDQDFGTYLKHQENTAEYQELYEKQLEKTCQARYLEVFHDVEKLIDNTIYLDNLVKDPDHIARSRLRQLVPTVGKFFTKLPLKEAFLIEDQIRLISRRRLVSPSFNDVRNILNTAQVIALTTNSQVKLKLITFDGDVTLYEDGKSLTPDSPIVQCLVELLHHDLFVAVVTAAGYPGHQGAFEYHKRLHGLIEVLNNTNKLLAQQKSNFLVMGGESNYLFKYNYDARGLEFIEGDEWYLPLMRLWDQGLIKNIMDVAYHHMEYLRKKMRLDDDTMTKIIRKERSLGIIPVPGYKILRETLEEIVLSLLNKLNEILNQKHKPIELYNVTSELQPITITDDVSLSDIRVCAFNGGADVWVDIGDKALGVAALQRYLCKFHDEKDVCPINKSESLHIGDQFASVGANDFKARLSACTVWIANPRETKKILDFLIECLNSGGTGKKKKD